MAEAGSLPAPPAGGRLSDDDSWGEGEGEREEGERERGEEGKREDGFFSQSPET